MQALLRAYRLACSLEQVRRSLPGAGRWPAPAELEDAVCFGWPLLAQSQGRSLILFAGTIGEFNAVRRFVEAYKVSWPDDRLVFLIGQAQYAEALHAAIPDSVVAVPSWRAPHLLDRFFELSRPRLVAYAEGPSLHGRFPVHLELPLSAACLYHAAPLVVLNARVYDLNLPSRIDRVEHALFAGLHRDAVTRWFAPDEGFRDDLRRAGAASQRISVVGDLKFDNAASQPDQPPAGLPDILNHFRAQNTLLIVGGSVNALDDQQCLIAAWRELRREYPQARLIIAPRYLQNTRVLSDLCSYLQAEGISYQLRSALQGSAVDADVLIIDVFGELRFYYELAAISYVGRNHGVLEPLRYRKPTVVADDWRRDHPSFPLYDEIVKAGAVVHVKDKTQLGAAFIRILRDRGFAEGIVANAVGLIERNAGAAQRIMEELLMIC